MSSEPEFVEFSYADQGQLARIAKVWTALRRAKVAQEFTDEAFWLEFFDSKARAAFWWPTQLEADESLASWLATPVDERELDPSLRHGWHFGSLIEAFRDGEYEMLECRDLGASRARLEYEPLAHPFGGTGCMRALVEAFGCKVESESDV